MFFYGELEKLSQNYHQILLFSKTCDSHLVQYRSLLSTCDINIFSSQSFINLTTSYIFGEDSEIFLVCLLKKNNKSCVTHKKCLGKAVSMTSLNLLFYGEVWINLSQDYHQILLRKSSLISAPDGRGIQINFLFFLLNN